MSLRHLLIVFFSVLAASLVILIMFFSLFFDKLDLSFNTHIPEAAPQIKWQAPSKTEWHSPEPETKTSGEEAKPGEEEPEASVGFTSETDSFWPKSALVNVPGEVEGVQNPEATTETEEDNEEPAKVEIEASAGPPIPEQPTSEASGEEPDPNRFTQFFQNLKDKVTPVEEKPAEKPKSPQVSPTPQPLPMPQPKSQAKVSSESSAASNPAEATSGSGKLYRVYIGGFSSSQEAESAKQRYVSQGFSPIVKTINGQPVLQIGVYSNASAARGIAAKTGAAVQAE